MSANLVTLPQVTVTTGGTRVRLSSSPVNNAIAVYISVPAANTGNIWIGDDSTLASSGRGIEIVKGNTLVLQHENVLLDIYNLYADGTTGDDVSVAYLTKV